MIKAEHMEALAAHPTPYYSYDLVHLKKVIDRASGAAGRYGYHIHYAMKANADQRILEVFRQANMGVDCVSGAEVSRALEIGFAPSVIAFAGVGKTDAEIDLALEHGIFTLNVESVEELKVIAERAEALRKPANVALRLNPDVNAKTHHYITTGLEENKFGISAWQLDEVIRVLREHDQLTLTGLHFHIGSQVTQLEPFKNLCSRVNDFQQRFVDEGFHIEHINAGGGLGIDYDRPDDLDNPDFEAFFGLFNDYLELLPGQQLHFELGRSLVATCGDLIARVIYVKHGRQTNFAILDAGMTELIRPALYQSYHKIENISRAGAELTEKYDVVGPVCESSDCFGKAVMMAPTKRGDMVAIRAAGAYGESMASHYNLRSLESPVYFDS